MIKILEFLKALLGIVPKIPQEEVSERAKEKTDIKTVEFNSRELTVMKNFIRDWYKLHGNKLNKKEFETLLKDKDIPELYYELSDKLIRQEK